MSEHPGIVFRPGPARWQAALASGPDAREVARAAKSARSTEPEQADDRPPGLIADAAAALRMPAVRGVQNGDPCTLLARFWETVQGCEAAGPCVAEAGGFGQAVSRMALRLRRSLRVARFMAIVMRGAVSSGKPAGSPRLRSVIRVEPSSMACQV